MSRVYTAKTETVSQAMRLAVAQGLVSQNASQSEKLAKLVEFARSQLSEERDRTERIKAYEAISRDNEREQAIRSSVINNARHGLI